MSIRSAFAAVIAAGAAAFTFSAGAEAQSSAWRLESVGPRGMPIATSCDVRRRGEVCAVVWCPRGEMQFAISGGRRGRNDARGGSVAVDGRYRSVNWYYSETRGGQSMWIADLNPPRQFFSRLRNGYEVTADLGGRRPPLTFTLRGSGRAVGAVQNWCGGDYRGGPPPGPTQLEGADLFEALIAGVIGAAIAGDDDHHDDRGDRYDDRRGGRYGDRYDDDRYDGRRGGRHGRQLDYDEVRRIVRQEGFRNIGHIEYRRSLRIYEVQAQGRRGRPVQVNVDAYSGDIISVER